MMIDTKSEINHFRADFQPAGNPHADFQLRASQLEIGMQISSWLEIRHFEAMILASVLQVSKGILGIICFFAAVSE